MMIIVRTSYDASSLRVRNSFLVQIGRSIFHQISTDQRTNMYSALSLHPHNLFFGIPHFRPCLCFLFHSKEAAVETVSEAELLLSEFPFDVG